MIFIGLGSNLGNRKENLHESIKLMEQKDVNLVRMSSIYRSKAWGFTDQEDFYNAVAEVSFKGSAKKLLSILHEVEEALGRVRTVKWGPRTIDLDIIEFNRMILESRQLMLPHPLYTQRAFVLLPLLELEPAWVPTGDSRSIEQILAQFQDMGLKRVESHVAS